ncbi:MAG: hypothetical protein HC817_09135 [Saprospiraceae bacterium]|nr:hypothetical protein [Saprospiraceae bacterium]
MQIPRFTAPPHFYNELKARVNEYFEETKQAPTGNWRLFSKSLVIVSLHVLFYTILVFFTPPGWYALIFCVLLGFSTAAIGFNIMHDGSHGSFSENKVLNRIAAFSLNVLGGNDYMWNVKHCVVHHSFTNVAGVDDDIEIAFMRMCESQPLRPWHRFQAIYFVVLYSLLYLFWLFVFDFKKYFVGKVGMMPIPKMKISQHIGFWSSKIGCYFSSLRYQFIWSESSSF